MVSEWWDRPAYEPCPRHRSRLLDDEEYDYAAEVYLPQQVPWAPPPPKEEEAEEVVISVEEYPSLDLSEEEAIDRPWRRASSSSSASGIASTCSYRPSRSVAAPSRHRHLIHLQRPSPSLK
jgi:hypothetical protein